MNHHYSGLLGIFFVVLCLLLTQRPAQADEIWSYGELSCSGNRAVLRFAKASNTDLPVFQEMSSVTGQLRPLPLGVSSCTLANGRLAKFKLGDMQRYAHGWCGGGLRSFTSLWVDERKVLSRQRVLSACFSDHYADVIVLDGDKLLLCRSPDSLVSMTMTDDDGTGCRDASHLLADAQHDPAEYPPDGVGSRTVGSIEVPFAEDAELCAEFLTVGPKTPSTPAAMLLASSLDGPARQFAVSDTRISRKHEDISTSASRARFRLPGGAALLDFRSFVAGLPSAGEYESAAFAHVDFDNDGHRDLVFRRTGTDHYFDGTQYFIPAGSPDESDVQEVLRKLVSWSVQGAVRHLSLFDLESPLSYTGPFSDFAPDYRDRYTYQIALRHEGETLVFATPLSRSVRPTAVVYRPRPGGEAEAVCVFQRVEENY